MVIEAEAGRALVVEMERLRPVAGELVLAIRLEPEGRLVLLINSRSRCLRGSTTRAYLVSGRIRDRLLFYSALDTRSTETSAGSA